MPISTDECHRLLQDSYARAEKAFLQKQLLTASKELQALLDMVFDSKTQAYREVLLGCLLARLADRTRDVHLPYLNQGPAAFSGRSLDEAVVNPFLQEQRIPCSRGPYLSVFRRQVRFDKATRDGVKDKEGYDALLRVLEMIAAEEQQRGLLTILDLLLSKFIVLREQSNINLIRIDRISHPQYERLAGALLARQSGGVFPVLLALAMIETVIKHFGLRCKVEFHGINVADKPSGSSGDITLVKDGKPAVVIEITERPLDVARVRATFTEKIANAGLSEYIFGVHAKKVDDEARQLVEKYFAQGYDVNLLDIQDWLFNNLATCGPKGRTFFQERLIHHLGGPEIPKALKVAWNEEIGKLIA